MQISPLLVYLLGFLAQALFSARMLVQWIMSERQHRVVSPSIFWILSLGGSALLFLYGWLRGDFSIILGQILSYYIYIWNLSIKGLWQSVPAPLRWALQLLPVVVIAFMASSAQQFVTTFFHNTYVPMWLLLLGTTGQVIFTLRFVYQWYHSRRQGQSVLPLGFWLLSLLGSGIIIIYGLLRFDPVLVVGHSMGFAIYTRNAFLSLPQKESGA